MKVIFRQRFYEVYTSDPAVASGRMEPMVEELEKGFEFVEPEPASEKDLARVHGRQHIQWVKEFALQNCRGRRFGVLEGGYNHSVLGRNVESFLQGLRD